MKGPRVAAAPDAVNVGDADKRRRDIAVIGMGCRFPEAPNLEAFWGNLVAGRNSIAEMPAARWSQDARSKFRGGFLDNVDHFDPSFFSISPIEAEAMDPQQRLLLEVIWHTLEHARIKPSSLVGSDTGVFIGACNFDYADLLARESEPTGLFSSTGVFGAILANRISYVFDWRGPSLMVDTACSSSLVAIHLAVKALQSGECNVAIAGGVNLCWNPRRFAEFAEGGMLSSDGQCKTFDASANGYVRGEGIGAILLKPLADAIRDGNQICGVIRGSAVNHGGKTKGLTVTSVNQQSNLLVDAYRSAGVHPETVGYIEAHGTGTSLGDPIEFLALNSAFKTLGWAEGRGTGNTGYCALGSVKTNIGHLEAAAGIAGIIKVLLSLQNKVIPASLNLTELNPLIKLEGTPFRVSTQRSAWGQLEHEGRLMPRIAGVSSFGFGGAYAHVVLEEYERQALEPAYAPFLTPHLVTISARTNDRLLAVARDLREHLDREKDLSLQALAHSLQATRDAFDERLALVCESLEDLGAKLDAFLTKAPESYGVYRDRASSKHRSLLEPDAIAARWAQRDLAGLAQSWVKGQDIDWGLLFDPTVPTIALPHYPFAGRRYWFQLRPVDAPSSAARLHPLLQENISNLAGLRFGSRFNGGEHFLSDHVVNGTKVLPGVCYLEMARAAIERSAGTGGVAAPHTLRLRDVVWIRPLAVDAPVNAEVHLLKGGQEEIRFAVRSSVGVDGEGGGDDAIHAQGRAEMGEPIAVPRIDLEALLARCDRNFDSDTCYEAFDRMGLEYGPAHRGLSEVRVGTNEAGERFVLARISMPDGLKNSADQFGLHPTILDSALQASIGFKLADTSFATSGSGPHVPFSLERLEVLDHTPLSAWAWLAPSRVGGAAGPATRQVGSFEKLDIVICDDSGRACVQIVGFCSREMRGAAREPTRTGSDELLLLQRSWRAKSAAAPNSPSSGEHVVFLAAPYASLIPGLRSRWPATSWEQLPDPRHHTSIATAVMAGVEAVFARAKTILQGPPKAPALLQVIVPTTLATEHGAGPIAALLKSVSKENPALLGRVITLSDQPTVAELIQVISENGGVTSGEVEVRYIGPAREVAGFHELLRNPDQALQRPWRDNGVYLIAGGGGALGLILAKEISESVSNAKIILAGRSEPSDRMRLQIDGLTARRRPTRIEYLQLDVSDRVEVQRSIKGIQQTHGALNGIIQNAGIIRDGFAIRKDVQDLQSVLAPKVMGTVNLDLATRDIPLDFFIMFSSSAAALGSVGQCDYAAANAFLDEFADHRNRLVRQSRRFGRTLAIDWPLWVDGGMRPPEAVVVDARQQGFDALQTETGVRALYQAWAAERSQVLVLVGNGEKLRRSVAAAADGFTSLEENPATEVDQDAGEQIRAEDEPLRAGAIQLLKRAMASILKLEAEWIDESAALAEFGIDSILALKIANQMEEVFGSLPKTLMFEHPTIEALASYLVETHGAPLSAHLGIPGPIAGVRSEAVGGPDLPSSGPQAVSTNAPLHTLPTEDAVELRHNAIDILKDAFGAVLKLEIDWIDETAALEEYGIDSILALKIVTRLEGTFGSLPKTLIFEHPNLDEMASYLIATHRATLTGRGGQKHLAFSEPQQSGHSTETSPILTPSEHRPAAARPLPDSPAPRMVAGRGVPCDIAIVGIAGRYPQADNLQELWNNLKQNKDCIVEIPSSRWDYREYFDAQKGASGKTYSKWGGFINDVDMFDPLHFNISPRDAEYMDPQERLFLQCVYETVEDAGYTRESLRIQDQLGQPGNIGVFVGVMYQEYQLFGAAAQALGEPYALLGSPASIANRVSHFFNFQGPSVAVDTMCSSSLTAIHLACQGLRTGDCSIAIAGGVNLSIHPNKYLMLARGMFASSAGRCQSFGAGGDGYVPGEGVGAVMLKPIDRAIADGDHIYGVIKATTVNHGGQTNGYTVPSPRAQAQVISAALEQAGVHPRAVSYVEAHGTGTSLGDPIEIAGLAQSFARQTNDTQYCAIGSIKSNIGHLESAAGIAGLTKVLLQMQHRALLPNLHSTILNPYIDFEQTPFRVQQSLEEWKRPVLEDGALSGEFPLVAGVSSFGAGGSNAHLIVEEYCPPSAGPVLGDVNAPKLFVFSARTEAQLTRRAAQLLDHLRAASWSEGDLLDIAYTLQVGREAMGHRLAFVAASLAELEQKLDAYISKRPVEALHCGEVRAHRDAIALIESDEDLRRGVSVWVEKGKYDKLLDLWTRGLPFDWNLLYGSRKPKRVSLPTYPFAQERFWVPVIAKGVAAAQRETPIDLIHPLLHENVSDLWAQRYRTSLHGSEFFLRDHLVTGERVLPAVAYLELARAAACASMRMGPDRAAGVTIANVAWTHPVTVDAAVELHTELEAGADGSVSFEIYSAPAAGGSDSEAAHAQGRITVQRDLEAASIDLAGLKAMRTCLTLSSAECYAAYAAAGFEYGPSHRSIEELQVLEDNGGSRHVLARLVLPEFEDAQPGGYVIHPSIMDGALQATLGLREAGPTAAQTPMLPFALESAEILAPTPSRGWAWVRYSPRSSGAEGVLKLDIDVCDESGEVCVRMRKLSARFLPPPVLANFAPELSTSEQVGAALLAPRWEVVRPQLGSLCPQADERVLVVGAENSTRAELLKIYANAAFADFGDADIESIQERIRQLGSIDHIVWLAPRGGLEVSIAEDMIGDQARGALQCFRLIKAAIALGYGAKRLRWTIATFQAQAVIPHEDVEPTHASVHGLAGCMAKEFPDWQVRLFDAPSDGEWPLTEALTSTVDAEGDALAYRNGQWYRQHLLPIAHPGPRREAYRKNGVYVVIGGAGGIGMAWSEHVIRTCNAQVIWIGRRPKDDLIEANIARLAAFGPSPYYIAADAAESGALERACEEVEGRYGTIHGVIHSSVVLQDRGLAAMDEPGFLTALVPKVDVSVRIAQVFADRRLDFALFFSSLVSFNRTAGQGNYAAGCTFTDALAHQIGRACSYPVKIINWGYWGSVGVASAMGLEARMARMGLASIEAEEGMAALDYLLSGAHSQLVYAKTTAQNSFASVQSIHPGVDPSISGRSQPMSRSHSVIGV